MKSVFCFAVMVWAAAAWAEPQSLTLTTYNIHSGIPAGHSHGDYQAGLADLKNVAEVLTSEGAEIIALQEVRNKWPYPAVKMKGEAPDMALEMARLMKMNYAFGSTIMATNGYPENRDYLQWGSADKSTSSGTVRGNYGNAVLSRFTMSKPETFKLPLAAPDDAKKANDEPRNAVRVELTGVDGFGPVVVYATHFQHNNGHTRERQMKALLQAAKADATSATVFLMGDFNHSPHAGEPDLLGMVNREGFHDLAAEFSAATGAPLKPTMPGANPPTRIDYVFCSKPLKVTKTEVMETPVSDHYPLTVVVEAETKR